MAFEHSIRLRVAFSDTDMAGFVHFSNYFRYMEAAEHDFFRSLGYSIVSHIGGRDYGWPRVNVECQFANPLYFEDEFEVRLLVDEVRSRSIRYRFNFTKLSEHVQPIHVGQGSMVTVCVVHDPVSGAMTPVSLPAEIAALIQPAPRDLLEANQAAISRRGPITAR